MIEEEDFFDIEGSNLMALVDACHRNEMNTIHPKQINLLEATLQEAKALE